MTKQAMSIRLSETAEHYIDEILKSHPIYDGNRTRAIEHALEYTVKNERVAQPDPAVPHKQGKRRFV